MNTAALQLKTALSVLTDTYDGSLISLKARRAYEMSRIILPYGIKPDGVIFNRYYKPVGLSKDCDSFGGYDIYPKLTKEQINRVMPILNSGYFFDDGCPPWGGIKHLTRYVELLRKVMAELDK